MKHTRTRIAALAVLTSSVYLPAAVAQTTWYTSGASTSDAGVTADTSLDWSANWQDTVLRQQAPTGTAGTSGQLFANPGGDLAQDQNIMLLQFGDLGINSSLVTVDSAFIYASWQTTGSFPAGVTQTWTINGTTGAWNELTATWNNDLGVVDTGITYGTFDTTGPYVENSWYAFDVTDALNAYIAGDITGIAITNWDPAPNIFDGTEDRITFNSSDIAGTSLRPGLLVTTSPIPEPSAALLGLVGALALLRRRRA